MFQIHLGTSVSPEDSGPLKRHKLIVSEQSWHKGAHSSWAGHFSRSFNGIEHCFFFKDNINTYHDFILLFLTQI